MWNFDLTQTKAGQELVTTGEKTGVKKGEKNKALKIAKKLLTVKDITIEKIAEITELSLEEVKSLQVS